MGEVLNAALKIAALFALISSILVWLSNLKVNSSTEEEAAGRRIMGWAWGITIALALLKLMTMR